MSSENRPAESSSERPMGGAKNRFTEGDATHITHAVSHRAVMNYRKRIEELVRSGRADRRALDMFSKVGKHMMGSPSEWNDSSTAGRDGD